MLKVSSTSPLMRRPQGLQPCIHHTANTDCLACHLILSVRRKSFTRLTSALEGSVLVYGEGNKFEDAQADHDRRFIPSMDRCHQRSNKIKVGKLCFKLKEVKLIGTIISDNRMKTLSRQRSEDKTHGNNTEQASTTSFHRHC